MDCPTRESVVWGRSKNYLRIRDLLPLLQSLNEDVYGDGDEYCPDDDPWIYLFQHGNSVKSEDQGLNNTRPFSAIVSDVDGTLLLRVNDTVSARLRTIVSKITSRGVPFSIITGRIRPSAWRVHQDIGANATMICYQGAMAVDAKTGDVLMHERLDRETASAAIQFFTERGLDIRVYVNDELFVSKLNHEDTAYAERNYANLIEVDDLMPLASQLPTLVLAVADPREMDEHVAAASALFGSSAEVTHSLPHFCEIGSPRAGKVKALRWLAERYSLDAADYISFGDGLGDLEMTHWSGRGYAVGDAHPSVIMAAAQHISGPASEGVAIELESLEASGMLAAPD